MLLGLGGSKAAPPAAPKGLARLLWDPLRRVVELFPVTKGLIGTCGVVNALAHGSVDG